MNCLNNNQKNNELKKADELNEYVSNIIYSYKELIIFRDKIEQKKMMDFSDQSHTDNIVKNERFDGKVDDESLENPSKIETDEDTSQIRPVGDGLQNDSQVNTLEVSYEETTQKNSNRKIKNSTNPKINGSLKSAKRLTKISFEDWRDCIKSAFKNGDELSTDEIFEKIKTIPIISCKECDEKKRKDSLNKKLVALRKSGEVLEIKGKDGIKWKLNET